MGRSQRPATPSTRRKGVTPLTVTVHVPMRFRRRGGRKTIAMDRARPSTLHQARSDPKPDPVLAALARAFYWRKLIDTGVHGSVAEIAGAEGINDSYVSRILRLTLLAPDIVEAIVHEDVAREDLKRMLRHFHVQWAFQYRHARALPSPARAKSA